MSRSTFLHQPEAVMRRMGIEKGGFGEAKSAVLLVAPLEFIKAVWSTFGVALNGIEQMIVVLHVKTNIGVIFIARMSRNTGI
ncbi:hypothetical protein PsorP6_011635 [Peronosclerospora sorghi]|uniref:Uncharacterized protein n=1 Tax=Peronosclerospora sorghi TaxID=230839 RepID=A0ACC0WK84_9STRA|nr:hypothetical protein PsorP6_011635 [Peronosclerospora sorghi]